MAAIVLIFVCHLELDDCWIITLVSNEIKIEGCLFAHIGTCHHRQSHVRLPDCTHQAHEHALPVTIVNDLLQYVDIPPGNLYTEI